MGIVVSIDTALRYKMHFISYSNISGLSNAWIITYVLILVLI
jgi:hypothetical protein